MLASSTPDALWSAPSLRLLRPAAVSCHGISRGRLLDRCSLSIAAGTRLLLLGEPQSSASLLVRILAGLVRPRRGSISVAGVDGPPADAGGRRVGYVGPDSGIPGWMTPREALALAADLAGMTPDPAGRAIARVVAHARIPGDALDQPIRRGGAVVAQRTGLATALLADPDVLLLDEPLRALDPEERTDLLRLPRRRRTVVLASRDPRSEAGLVTHVGLLRGGRVALLAPVAELEAAGLRLTATGIAQLAERAPRPHGPGAGR